MQQDKQKERDFFENFACLPGSVDYQDYNVFTDKANDKIIDTVQSVLQLPKNARIVDLGCGSGVFTQLLNAQGFDCLGIDLSHRLLQHGKSKAPTISFLQGDVEFLPFVENSLDYVMLSCLVHHLPDPKKCAQEVFRVLKPGGRFVAFDPNRLNPIMYLYRDRSSPFYSSKGVTPNERPVLPNRVRQVFQSVGFESFSHFVDGLSFRYITSDGAKYFLPIYNFIDRTFFKLPLMKVCRAFVFTYGRKPV